MSSRLPFLVLPLLFVAAAVSAATVEDEIRRIIVERKEAAASGDAVRWGKHIADECIWVGDSDQRTSKAEVAASNSINDGSRMVAAVLDLQVRQSGDTLTATYIQEDRSIHNGKTVVARYMYLDTYARRDGRWMLLASSETPIPSVPAASSAVRIDPRVLETYVGEYEYLPKAILRVSRDGDRLMAKLTNEEQASELLAENETTFFEPGKSWRWIFVKQPDGRVSHMVFRHRGNDAEMPRLK
jgi:ketosteroid isomerase-like protein